MKDGVNACGDTSKGKGKAVEPNEVRAPKALRPVCACSTSNIFRTLCRKNQVLGIAQCQIV